MFRRSLAFRLLPLGVGLVGLIAACNSTASPSSTSATAPNATAPSTADATAPGTEGGAPKTAGVPDEVIAHLDTLTVTIELRPREPDNGPGLRNGFFDVGHMLREPSSPWPDGTPRERAAKLGRADGERWVRELGKRGFFENATRHHSPSSAAAEKLPPPAESRFGPTPQPPAPGAAIVVSVTDDDFHRSHQLTLAWADVGRYLAALRPGTEAPALGLLDALEAESKKPL